LKEVKGLTFSANKSLEDAEKQFLNLIEQERFTFKKKENASKEII
jgi:hypothetical protein